MTQAYPATMCPKFAALRKRRKFHVNQIVDVTIDCGLGTASPARQGCHWLKSPIERGYSLLGQLWRQGRKLLVLRFRRQAFVGLGVVDHLTQKFLAERRQRAFPQLPRGFALLDEAPLLRGNGAGVHAIGEMIDGATGDRIAFADWPFDRRNTAVT